MKRLILAALLACLPLAQALPAPAIDMAMYKGADRMARILDGAKREGKVVIYSGMIENQALRPLADAFKKKYPFVTLEYWRGDSRGLMQKVTTERRAGRVMGDVFETTGAGEPAIRAGVVVPFYSPETAAYPKNYAAADGMWAASRLDYFAMAYNTRLVSAADVPKTYEELLNPKWKGQIAWRADTETGATLMISAILESMGPVAGEAYLKKLATQKIVNYVGSARALVDRVGQGEYKLALGIYAHHPIISKALGAPLDTQMLEPVPSSVSTIQLLKGAPHPNAAMLLIDFILSKEGQTVLKGATYLSPNPAVAPDPSLNKIVPRIAHLKEVVFTPELLFSKRDVANALYDKYFK